MIGGQEVKVKTKKNLHYEGKDMAGLCDYDNNTLWLCTGMPKSKKLSVFVHEYWHYVSGVYDLNLSEKQVIFYEVETLRLLNSLGVKYE